MEHSGGCHCGNIHVRIRLSKPPEDNPLRACTCSFCRSHSPRMAADREGLLSDRERFTALPAVHDFEGETIEIRSARRTSNWMPTLFHR